MLIPEMLTYMRINGFSYQAQALVMGAYVLGLYAFGPFVSYLVEGVSICDFAVNWRYPYDVVFAHVSNGCSI